VRGLRLQIVCGLALLVVLAFVPLFSGLSRLTQNALEASRTESARALGRVIAAHIADVRALKAKVELSPVLESHIGSAGALAIAVFDDSGLLAAAGRAAEVATIPPPVRPFGEATHTRMRPTGLVLDVLVPQADFIVIARLRLDDQEGYLAKITQLFALYTSIFAAALVMFSYIFLTRLIVRPVEELARAADRVASGAAALEVPARGAQEVLALGESLNAMTARLFANEEALKKKIVELERTTKHLVETRSQLAGSERLASVGRLAAGLAHEIGNPITAMIGMQELLIEGGLPGETERDFLKRMRAETERVHTIVRDLLDFARSKDAPPSGSGELSDHFGQVTAGSILDAVDAVASLMKHQKGMREVSLHSNLPPGLALVALSTQRVTQVLLNLVLNAKDAVISADRGVPAGIRIGATSTPTHVVIEVEDDGTGVPESSRARIFDPFFTLKDVGLGTGLGLSVCRGLVESAGGTIELDSTYTTGARFVVRIPRVPPAAT
jgi:two-component system, NtrC family, sensor kinase